ncbi:MULTISPECIES: BMP family ABC transporter substrate-binding protein [unclassified Leucobacter]|uniref:BMP family ABC transporter substrate-binding protein n=1 Tax=unclassified Leucobacter TaxID=2621730 RepID=UPI00165E9470|nr:MULTISPECIES: BMP family ABC transporter substrate-binding protein [unclassified Leucobacter]MBC9928160.1 BMP family ABC transporter substrate-binding protein [Leucobacter sp. cx-169]
MIISSRRAKAALTATAALSVLALTACGGGGSADSGDAAPADGPKFVYITSDPIGQNAFLQSGKDGIEAVATEFEGTAKTFEGKDEATRRSHLEAAIAEAPEVVVMLGFQFGDVALELAEQNPQQKFLLIDTFVEGAPENLYQATFREQEPSYLLGVEAGLLTEANKVGSVLSLDIPLLAKYSGGFAEGAKSVNPAVETVAPQIIGGDNPFADTARAKEQALAYAASGVDQVFAVGAAANPGIMEAAAEKGFFAYGVDTNQCPLAPGFVVDGSIKAVNAVVETVVGEIMDGTSAADATTSFGLAEGGMTIVSLTDDAADSQCTVMENPEVLEQVQQAFDDIVAGKIKVTDPLA